MDTYQQQLERRQEKIKKALARQQDMLTLRRAGKTMQEIGDEYGLTRARVSQILQMAEQTGSAENVR